MYNILIVDDEPTIAHGINAKINYLQIDSIGKVAVATNLKKVEKVIEEMNIHLIITDMKMPDISGIDLIKKIKKKKPKVKYIVISGYDDYLLVREAFKLDILDYLVKPINSEELRKLIEKALLTIQNEYQERITHWIEHYINDGDISDLHEVDQLYAKELHNQNKMIILFKFRRNAIIQSDDIQQLMQTGKILFMNSQYCYYLVYGENIQREVIIKSVRNLIEEYYRQDMVGYIGDLLHTTILEEVIKLNQLCQRNYLLHDFVCSIEDEANRGHNPFCILEVHKFLHQLRAGDYYACADYLHHWFDLGTHYYSYQSLNMMLEYIMYEVKALRGVEVDLDIEVIDDFLYVKELYRYLKKIVLQYCHAISSREESKINIAKRYIEENYSRDLSMREVVDQLSLNYSYFSQIFKKEVGMSFKNYLMHIKMQKAKYLLKNSSLKIRKVSEKVGFNDPYHFSRTFKKQFNQSPQEFRGNGGD